MASTESNFLEMLFHYYTIIMHQKWLIVAITGVTTVATVIFALISLSLPPEKSPLPNFFTAEAILFVSQNNQTDISDSIMRALGMNQQSNQSTGFNNGDLILEILHSRTILDKLIEEFSIQQKYSESNYKKSTARQLLLENFNFIYARNTGSLRITFRDSKPVFAKDLVNRTVELLSEWFIQNRGVAKQRTKEVLEQKLSEVKTEIDSLQNSLKDLQRRYGVLNAGELSVSQATSLANLRSQLIMKEIEIKNYSSYSRINDPRLEQLNEELQNLRDLISRNQTTLPDISKDSGRSRSIADVAQEFSQIANELDIQQRIYNTLSPQYEAAKLSPESEPIFEVFELAEIPDEKTGPKRSKIVVMAFTLSLGFGITLVLGLNQLKEWKVQIKNGGKSKSMLFENVT